MTLEVIVVTVIKTLIVFFALLTGFAYLTLFERKVQARLQQRPGPNRVGPWGLLQPAADGLKLFFKSSSTPAGRDHFLYLLAPFISVSAALASFAIIPISGPGTLNVFGHSIGWYVMNANIGVLWYFAVTSVGVYGIFLAGYGSNSKYSMLGALRSSAQMISYEMALGLSLVPVFILAGSLKPVDIVNAQKTWWFVIPLLPSFFLYLIAGIAETNRAPFDLPEAETELVAGYHTEYSGIKFAMFFLAEYTHTITVSAVGVTLFLGGWHGPMFDVVSWLWPVLWFMLKLVVVVFVLVWVRATLPRFRYDRLMSFGWKVLIPVGLLWVLVTAAYVQLPNSYSDGRAAWIIVAGTLGVILLIAPLYAGPPRGDPTRRAAPGKAGERGR